MQARIKEIRKALGLKQEDFGARLGISNTAVSKWEKGENSVPDSAILSICREFGVSETWLRDGVGEMFPARSREEELGRLVAELLADRPESFRAALITTLLRFDPAGPEWAALEAITQSLLAEWQAQQPPGSSPANKEDPEP